MKNLLTFICLLLLLGGLPYASQAQDTPPTYFVIDYMKTKPGMGSEYVAMEQAWKKLHQARIEAGKLGAWGLQRVVSPTGTHAEYNYITFNRYDGNEQLAAHYETPMITEAEAEALLTDEEMELVMRTEDFRDLVKTEVWQHQGGTFADDWQEGRVHVFNYFKTKPGYSSADHLAMENELWKPLHAARVENGDLKGWAILTMTFPFGSAMPYDDATVDIYADMSQYLQPFFEEYVAKVHPDMAMEELESKTLAPVELLRGEVRMLMDYIEAENEE